MTRATIREGQGLHAACLAALLVAVASVGGAESVTAGELWRLNSRGWLWVAVAIAVAHQLWVWICWRLELHRSSLRRHWGAAAFPAFAAGFAVLGVARVASVWGLAVANAGTLPLARWLAWPLALAAAIPAAYLFYSVHRYFGFRRALGIDHFDASYRSLPLVREGIFRWTSNAMYTFGFLVFWAIALAYGSLAALVAAAFNHLYVWVHFFATERPDMRRMYG